MHKYDPHVHTGLSTCSNLRPATILKILKKKGYDGVCITDHHSIKGGLRVQKLNKDKNFEVVVSAEISTNLGDVLCHYLKKDIKSRDFYEVCDEVHKQGGIAVIPHPFRTSVNTHHKFKKPLNEVKKYVDAVEVFNARSFPFDNPPAKKAAQKHGFAQTGGSDAHFAFEVGQAYTTFDGDFRTAVRKKKTVGGGKTGLGPVGGLLSFIRNRIYS